MELHNEKTNIINLQMFSFTKKKKKNYSGKNITKKILRLENKE